MVTALHPEVKPGTSLKSLVNGFILTKQTEGKSPRTVEFYSENLKRFLWYASKQDWPDDIRMLTEWNIREFLGYLANENCRWGLEGNGSETSQQKASHSTVLLNRGCFTSFNVIHFRHDKSSDSGWDDTYRVGYLHIWCL